MEIRFLLSLFLPFLMSSYYDFYDTNYKRPYSQDSFGKFILEGNESEFILRMSDGFIGKVHAKWPSYGNDPKEDIFSFLVLKTFYSDNEIFTPSFFELKISEDHPPLAIYSKRGKLLWKNSKKRVENFKSNFSKIYIGGRDDSIFWVLNDLKGEIFALKECEYHSGKEVRENINYFRIQILTIIKVLERLGNLGKNVVIARLNSMEKKSWKIRGSFLSCPDKSFKLMYGTIFRICKKLIKKLKSENSIFNCPICKEEIAPICPETTFVQMSNDYFKSKEKLFTKRYFCHSKCLRKIFPIDKETSPWLKWDVSTVNPLENEQESILNSR